MKSFKMKAYGLIWNVKALKNHPDLKTEMEGGDEEESKFGVCNTARGEILISTRFKEDQQQSSLLHELIELVSTSTGLNLSENIVKTLESGLYHIIHDNRLKF